MGGQLVEDGWRGRSGSGVFHMDGDETTKLIGPESVFPNNAATTLLAASNHASTPAGSFNFILVASPEYTL